MVSIHIATSIGEPGKENARRIVRLRRAEGAAEETALKTKSPALGEARKIG